MALKAIIPSGMTEITVNGLHQWDFGQQLEIHAPDLQGFVEVHFACVGMNEAIARPCDMVGGVGTVTIPDACLEQTAPITAWVYEKDGATGTTTKTITLKVTPRARPTASEAPPPEAIDKYTEAVTAMNEAVGKMVNGQVTAAKATKAVEDLEGKNLVDNYHLGVVGAGSTKYFCDRDVNIDELCTPAHCGVYTIKGSTQREYEVKTLPDDVPSDASLKLIVEADWSPSEKVFQTLRARRASANEDRLLIWTRQHDQNDTIDPDVTWSKWRRLVSAEELIDGTVEPKRSVNANKAERATYDEDGLKLNKKLNLGDKTSNATEGYVEGFNGYTKILTISDGTGILNYPGLIMFYLRTSDGKNAAQVLVDVTDDDLIHSSAFLLSTPNTDDLAVMLCSCRLVFNKSQNGHYVTLQTTSINEESSALQPISKSLGNYYQLYHKYLAKY